MRPPADRQGFELIHADNYQYKSALSALISDARS